MGGLFLTKGELMIFSSITFLYIYLPLCLFFYYISPKKVKNITLLIFSLIFYSFQTPKFLPIMLGCIFLTYINALLIQKFENKIHYFLSLIICMFPLIIFKYLDFFIINTNSLFKTNITLLKLVLPLGISFYTFQMLSYLIDVKRKKTPAEKNILDLALYICFFPQLVAGPIVKYDDIKEQMHNKKINIENFSNGVLIFAVGLGKKVLIANQLGEMCELYTAGNSTIVFTWMYMIGYSLQVYFDFSGYSTMAIGLGKIFGFELPENFNYPFICSNIKDFWKRWHITLSSFFKEYVYIPLGGSRCSATRNVFNLFVVWALTGFWHGANWNFICWGLFFFVLLLIEKYIIKDKWPKILQRILTVFMVGISFVIFGATNMNDIFITVKNLFIGTFIDSNTTFVLRNNALLLIFSIIGATPLLRNIYRRYIKETKISVIIEPLLIAILIIISTAYLIDGSFNPFLYFRF